jgi:hypothetical protein
MPELLFYKGFSPLRLLLVSTVYVSFPCGKRQAFLFRDLAGNFSNCGNGFLSLPKNIVTILEN